MGASHKLSWRKALDIWYVHCDAEPAWVMEHLPTKLHVKHYQHGLRLANAIHYVDNGLNPREVLAFAEAMCTILSPHTKSDAETLIIAEALAAEDIIDPHRIQYMKDFQKLFGIGDRYSQVLKKVRQDLCPQTITVRVSHRCAKLLMQWAEERHTSIGMVVDILASEEEQRRNKECV